MILDRDCRYRLIALDVDGTAVNDGKYLLPDTVSAAREAMRKGVEVVFCSGRSPAEMREYFRYFPEMRYFLGECGALLYDLKEERPLFCARFEEESWRAVVEIASETDTMPGVYHDGQIWFNAHQIGLLADYGQELYVRTLPPASRLQENVFDEEYMMTHGTEKFCIFHRNTSDREKTYYALEARKLPVTIGRYAKTSVEVQPQGVDKGSALRKLGEIIGIPLSRMVMVGDSDNDLPALTIAGLSIAMANGEDEVKAVCDMTTKADNNSGGCAEAIRTVLSINDRVNDNE